MGILVKYSKIMGRDITVYKNDNKDLLCNIVEEINVDIKDVAVEEVDLLKIDDEINDKIEQLKLEEEKYEKYSKRALVTGDNEGAGRLLDKKYEAEEKKIELIRKEKSIKDSINKLISMKCKLEEERKEIEEVLYKVD